MKIKTIGIVGAGKVGIVLAQLALKAGYSVYIAGSGSAEKIALSVKVLTPGAIAVTSAEAVEKSDLVILALPLGKFKNLPASLLDDTLVIDAMNYWWEVDGPSEAIIPSGLTSSEAVQDWFKDARIVKAFSHMGYHELHDENKPSQTFGRKAIAIAGDNTEDNKAVAEVIDTFGFDPLVIGTLKEGIHLEPGQAAFGANVDIQTLKRLVS